MWHVYYRSRQFLVPVVAQTKAGFFLDIEPVLTVQFGDVDDLEKALVFVIAAGNPKTETPSRGSFPRPAVLGPARVKTWATFEKKSICWTITDNGSDYLVAVTGRAPSGGWVDDEGSSIRIAGRSGARGVVVAIRRHLEARKDV